MDYQICNLKNEEEFVEFEKGLYTAFTKIGKSKYREENYKNDKSCEGLDFFCIHNWKKIDKKKFKLLAEDWYNIDWSKEGATFWKSTENTAPNDK